MNDSPIDLSSDMDSPRITLVGLGKAQPAANDTKEESGIRRVPTAPVRANRRLVRDGGVRI